MEIIFGIVCLAGGVGSLLFGLAQSSHSSPIAIIFFVIAGILAIIGGTLLHILGDLIDGIGDIF